MEVVQAVAPSNIALIKYWGREDERYKWPCNDSLSMTLSAAKTHTSATIIKADDHKFKLNGRWLCRKEEPKIFSFLDFLVDELAGGRKRCVQIQSENTFPTGCGIASSASGFAALTLAACGALVGKSRVLEMMDDSNGLDQLAGWARLGSGSATRSLFGGFVLWQRGAQPKRQRVTRLFELDHWLLFDTIVLFSDEKKPVSSSSAHKLAASSPLFKTRLAGLPDRMTALKKALDNRSIADLGALIETECLEMHAVMMTSDPPVFYFDHRVGNFLAWLRKYRSETGLKAYFTIDAGPNVHVLCEPKDLEQLHSAIRNQIPDICLFVDKVGTGPSVC